MRLLQLTTTSGLLDLHPCVSVVQAVDAADREALAQAVAGLARARAVGEGLLEAHGVMFPLDQDLLALIDLRHDDLGPVVRPADLPGAAAALAEREAAFRAVLDRLAAAVEAHTQAVADLEAATAERRRAKARVTRAAAALEAAEAEEATAVRSGSRDADALADLEARRADLQARLDDGAAAALGDAGARWRQLHLAAPPPRGGEPPEAVASAPGDDPAEQPEAVDAAEAERRFLVIDELLAELTAVDPEPVRSALVVARARAEQLEPVPEAIALAEALEALDAEIAAAEADGVPELTDADRAVADRLEAARLAVADAEDAARDLALDPADVEALEAAHEALIEALDRAERRLAGPRARQRVEQARAAEQAILDRLGLVSYTDYLMGTSTRHRRPGAEAALQAARAELAAAEQAWDEVRDRHALVLAHADRLERRRGLVDEARRLLGGAAADDDLPRALREPRGPAPVPPVVVEELVAALDDVGIDLGEGPHDLDDVVLVAETWLAEADRVDERIAELTAERDALAAPAAPAEAPASGAGPSEPAEPVLGPDELAARAEATAALEAAERRHQAHRDALEALAALETELDAARAAAAPHHPSGSRAAEARAALEAAQAALVAADERKAAAAERRDALARDLAALESEGQAAATELEALQDEQADGEPGRVDRDQLEWFLMAKVAAQRSASLAGSTPLLVEDPFPGVDGSDLHHLLDQLERLADTVQVILVSDAPELAAWAERAGEHRAAVVRPAAR